MTRRPPGEPSGEFATAEVVAGLAREVDGLRRDLDTLTGLPGRVDDLSRSVAQLADAVAAIADVPTRPGPTPAPSWLACPPDPEVTGGLLADLTRWLHGIFLRYPDGVAALPECWLWHPDLIEELLWLRHAWSAAYQARGASVQNAGDWHDRQRPGVVRRLRALHGSCSPENHQQRPGWTTAPSAAVSVPGLEDVDAISGWWATGRDQPAPEPRTHRHPGGFGDVINGAGGGPAVPRHGSGGPPW